MTTTSTFQGMGDDSRNSSRVLAPPGGGSSNIFGHLQEDAPATGARRAANKAADNNVLGQAPPAEPAPARQPAKKIAYNPITGEPYDAPKSKDETTEEKKENEKKEEEKKDEAATPAEPAKPNDVVEGGTASDNFRSTRVAQPPGGRSTKLW